MIEKIEHILDFVFIESKYVTLSLIDVLNIVLIFFVSRLITYLIKRVLDRRVKSDNIEEGKAYAIRQIASYFIYTIAIILALDSLGVKVTLLLAGSTALFVGLGLGLQDVLKDLASGIIILTERSVTAQDIVEIDDTVGYVLEVGLRTTKIRTRDDIEIIIPNQRLTSNHIVNWSRSNKKTRFHINVGVAYGSDTKLVKDVLTKVAKGHKEISTNPEPYVFFDSFGSSSLDFKIFFFSNNLFRIERVKSDLRFEIDQAFRENNITIAFPQMDVWFKKPIEIERKND